MPPVNSLEPIVFLGPSLSWADAKTLLSADYRPPIKRGDLTTVEDGRVVAIIDGEFHQSLAVSPKEIVLALKRGVTIFGCSSMGALRAAEVPGVVGSGQVFEMYASGLISRDDEVALRFDPRTRRPLTIPLVNVRYAVGCLIRQDAIGAALGERIIQSASTIPYWKRTYEDILKQITEEAAANAHDLISALEAIDLKREDATALLRQLSTVTEETLATIEVPKEIRDLDISTMSSEDGYYKNDHFHLVRASKSHSSDAPAVIWEVGDKIPFSRLLFFLKMTGVFESHARNVISHQLLTPGQLAPNLDRKMARPPLEDAAQTRFSNIRRTWGWILAEETHVTLQDLSLGLQDLSRNLLETTTLERLCEQVATLDSSEFRQDLRAELFTDGLTLKRELLRAGSFDYFLDQNRDTDPVTPEQLENARRLICRANKLKTWPELLRKVTAFGIFVDDAELFAQNLAHGRNSVARITRLDGALEKTAPSRFGYRTANSCERPFKVSSRRKISDRFHLSVADALHEARRIAKIIGITRIAHLGELGDCGVQISQVSRPAGVFSSTYGSGKGFDEDQSTIGGVMEETEKWALETFGRTTHTDEIISSYREINSAQRTLDPATCSLPYDSSYHPELQIDWLPCSDLISADTVLVPSALLYKRLYKQDICYSRRAARHVGGTNGLGAGFSIEEALVHAICEILERHALKLSEIRMSNPGTLNSHHYRFCNPDSFTGDTTKLIGILSRSGQIRILNITSEIAVPVFHTKLFIDNEFGHPVECSGFGCHPNPNVACRMALFESTQTWLANIAGGREDLSLKARSLGRHERPRPQTVEDYWFWQELSHNELMDAGQLPTLETDDLYEELLWLIDQCTRGGLSSLLVRDLSVEGTEPARIVRVMAPGIETTNPFHTGVRARIAALPDLFPQLPHGVQH